MANIPPEYLQIVLAQAPVVVFCVDRDGVITLSEGAGLRLLRREPGQMVGRSLAELTDVPWLSANIARALAGDSFRAVGEVRGVWLAVDYVPVRDDHGAVTAALGFASDVTEQKRLEARLREAEERYRRQSEAAFEALAIHDRGVIVDANPSFAHLFGYESPEQLIGTDALELAAPESRAMVRQGITAGGDDVYEAVGRRRDGSTFVAELRGRSVTWSGRSLRVTAIRDLEQQRRLEGQARQSAERLRVVVEGAPIVLFAIDPSGTFVVSEGRGLKQLGLEAGEVVGQSVFELYRDEPSVLAHIHRALAGEEFTAEVELTALGLVWQTTYAPLRDADGRVAGTIGVALDVTARKRAEQDRDRLLGEIDAERQRHQAVAGELSAMLEHMVDAVVVVDAAGRFTRANHAARVLFDIDTADEMTRFRDGGGVEVFRLDGSRIAPSEQALARALRGEVIHGEEVRLHMRGATLYLRASAAPIRDERGRITGAVGMVSDMTAEIAFDCLKDQFLSVAAHELKTPVAVIKTAAQTALQLGDAERGTLQRTIARIDRGASRIDRIVADLLDASQLQLGRLSLHTEALDLGVLVGEWVRRLVAGAPRHRIQVSCAPNVVVDGDRARLEQVVTVLVRNAIKYSPEGGDIDVSVARQDHEALVLVRDRGVGIARDKQPHVFESFYTAHGDTPYDFGGIGIGLHVAREFVKRHGGRIWFESEEGAGSMFAFALPLRHATTEFGRAE